MLNKTVNAAPDVMQKLSDLLDREVEKQDYEWKETLRRLIVTEKTETRLVAIRNWENERDCRSIVNQLVNSMPEDALLTTSYSEHQQHAEWSSI